MSKEKDQYTEAQLKRWKKHEIGRIFFDRIDGYIKDRENLLKGLSPDNTTMEVFYKSSVRLRSQIELARDLSNLRMEDLQEEKNDTPVQQ